MAGGPGGGSESTVPLTPEEIAVRIGLAVLLLLLAQTFTGLNIGLFAFDCGQLQVIIDAEHNSQCRGIAKVSNDARHARRVLPLRRCGNLTLCTILLGNTMVNASMALLMSSLAGGFLGWLLTTVIIVYIGEILPQSLCSRHGLTLGALGSPIIWVAVVLLFPITKLYAVVLDYLFPDEDGLMDRAGWKNMLEYQALTHPTMSAGQSSMLLSSLNLGDTMVSEVMVPMSRACCLAVDDEMNLDKLKWIQKRQFTRLPVYDGKISRFSGLLHCKDLLRRDLGVNFHRGGVLTVSQLLTKLSGDSPPRDICQVPESMSLLELVDMFKRGEPHLLAVYSERGTVPDTVTDPGEVHGDLAAPHVGLVTLHDVCQRILSPRPTIT